MEHIETLAIDLARKDSLLDIYRTQVELRDIATARIQDATSDEVEEFVTVYNNYS
jgi:hypothetical protein